MGWQPERRRSARRRGQASTITRLVSSTTAYLDGYVAGDDGRFDWADPASDSHRVVNEFEAQVGTDGYGRWMHEVRRVWL
jgi:hypothetical protein